MTTSRAAAAAIHWFRRDLRTQDNPGLAAAAERAAAVPGGQVVPVYVLSAWRGRHRWTSAVRQEFLCGCLRALDEELRALGGRLVVRTGEPAEVLGRLLRETGATALFYGHDPDPHGRAAEERVAAEARRHGAEARGCRDVALHERDELRTGSGTPYRVYSPYARAWSKLPKPAPRAEPLPRLRVPAALASEPLPGVEHWGLRPSGVAFVAPGAAAARRRFDQFLTNSVRRYRLTRDRPGLPAGTARLSQDLRWGLLSVREVYRRSHAVASDPALDADARENVQGFIGELAWREFYFQILFHYPEVLATEFNPALRGLPWRRDPAGLRRWREGTTGFPIVDAGLRQLAATGFMHNRVRMITAMFLTKDLRIDWRAGERWFIRGLVDGEIASNNGGWQWSAGVGADAAPYFRIQNPWTQGARYDPEGVYIREHLPELRDVPASRLHVPPAPGRRLHRDYPAPLVDHAQQRDETLRMFKEHLARRGGGRPA